MTNEQEMISTDMMTLAEQMELASVTRWLWPTPIEQLSQEEVVELGFATAAVWEGMTSTEIEDFWQDTLVEAYKTPPAKSWADQVEDEEELWEAASWSQVAWGRCHCGCEENETRFGAPSTLGM